MFRKLIVTEMRGFEIILLLSAYSVKNVSLRRLPGGPRRKEAPGNPDRVSGEARPLPRGRVRPARNAARKELRCLKSGRIQPRSNPRATQTPGTWNRPVLWRFSPRGRGDGVGRCCHQTGEEVMRLPAIIRSLRHPGERGTPVTVRRPTAPGSVHLTGLLGGMVRRFPVWGIPSRQQLRPACPHRPAGFPRAKDEVLLPGGVPHGDPPPPGFVDEP